MTNLVNQVQLIGRLGADAEVKILNQKSTVCNFSIATNERVKGVNGEWKENTYWHNCVVWGQKCRTLEKFGKKGNLFMVHGSIIYRDYEITNGIKRTIAEIHVNTILLLATVKDIEQGA